MRWFRDEKGVSPVIGVILMVAITVILAAVIASFVFGLGSKAPKSAPQASLVVSKAANNGTYDYILLDHQGGESIFWQDIQIVIAGPDGSTTVNFDNNGNPSGTNVNTSWSGLEIDVGTTQSFDPGERIKIVADGTSWGDVGDTIDVKVIHKPTGQTILSTSVRLT